MKPSNIKPKMHYIPILHHILFAFHPQLAVLAAARFTSELCEVFESNDFRLYEAALDVGVNCASCLVSGCPSLY